MHDKNSMEKSGDQLVCKCQGQRKAVSNNLQLQQLKSSGIKVGYVYPCRDTFMSMRTNTLPEERQIVELFYNQMCIAQTQCIGSSINTLKTNLPFIGGKASEISDW